MIQKECDHCRKQSFSSCTKGSWICPYCNKNITHLKAAYPTKVRRLRSVAAQQREAN
jgi:ribosomal protein L37AE/L43A